MRDAAASALLALAERLLGEERRDWAEAMRIEFEFEVENGEALGFACGCLTAACRALPTHEEGRFAIASHALACAIFLPVAASLVLGLLGGFPLSYLGHSGMPGLLASAGAQRPVLNDSNLSAVPALAATVLLLAALNLRMAWLAVERDWPRLIGAGALSAALATTLAILSAVVFISYAAALVPLAVVAVQFGAVLILTHWHAELEQAAQRLRSSP